MRRLTDKKIRARLGYNDLAMDALVHAMLKREDVDLEIIDKVCQALNTDEATLMAFAERKWDTVTVKAVTAPEIYRVDRTEAAPGHTEIAHFATEDDKLFGVVFKDEYQDDTVDYSWVILHDKDGNYQGVDSETGCGTQARATDSLIRSMQDLHLRLPAILALRRQSIRGTLLKHRDS